MARIIDKRKGGLVVSEQQKHEHPENQFPQGGSGGGSNDGGSSGGKTFFLRKEDAYHDSSDDGGGTIFVNPELFAEIEGEVNGESVCSVRLIGEWDDGTKNGECHHREAIIPHPSGFPIAEIYFDSCIVFVVKTTEDADAIIAMISE